MEHARRAARGSMTVGRADDPAERAADRFADSVTADLAQRSGDEPGPSLGRVPVTGTGSGRVHRSNAGADVLGGTVVDGGIEAQIRSASGGSGLPDTVRRSAERQSGRDLGGVRLHTGRQADQLSRSLHAEAFTSGSDIFMSGSAARAGTKAGDQLLAHEVGHVVQQGGGTVQRQIRRSTGLAPLSSSGDTTVRRFLGVGKKKSGKLDASNPALLSQQDVERRDAPTPERPRSVAPGRGSASKPSQMSPADQAAEFAKVSSGMAAARSDPRYAMTCEHTERMESSLRKLRSQPRVHASGGPMIADSADKLLATIPGSEKEVGFGPLRRRLRQISAEARSLADVASVAETKREAGDIYMRAGRDGGLDRISEAKGFFEDEPAGGQPLTDREQMFADVRQQIKVIGDQLGLTAAERTAIITFTSDDYRYINPAAANNRQWMLDNRNDAQKQDHASDPATRDAKEQQYVASGMEEGSLHTALAVSGLRKLPVWQGTTYRGEAFTPDEFDKKFAIKGTGKNKTVVPTNPVTTRPSISSTSQKIREAEKFASTVAVEKGSATAYLVVWHQDVRDGRDIAPFSSAEQEAEIATLPGAQFHFTGSTPYTKGLLFADMRIDMTRVFNVYTRQTK